MIWSDANAKVSARAKDLAPHWNDGTIISQKNKSIIHFGTCTSTSDMMMSGWKEIMGFKGYQCGGDLASANSDMVGKLADAIIRQYKAGAWRLTQ